MKLAKVIPIYKAKIKDEFSNYTPISLLPALTKVMEKVIHKEYTPGEGGGGIITYVKVYVTVYV